MTASYGTKIWYLMLFVRLIFGFSAGISFVVVPVYLTELSPNNLRGAVGTSHQLFLSLAILIANVFSLKHVFGTAHRWQHIYEMTFLPIVTQLFLLKFCPESSYFSLLFDDEATLIVLRRRPEVQVDVIAIRDETSNTKDQPRPTLGAVFSTSLRWATTLSELVMLMRQLSGMDVALQSILDVMITVGFTTLDGRRAMCGLMVDSSCFDRRPLRLIGIFGMFLSSVAVILALILIVSTASDFSYFPCVDAEAIGRIMQWAILASKELSTTQNVVGNIVNVHE